MVKIFSGDDTDFKGDQRLALTFAAPDVDFDGCTAEVEFLGQRRTFAQVTNGGRLVFSFTADETRGMRCGVWPVIIRLRDSSGRVRTVNNTNRIKVTNDVNEAYADGEQELAVALTSGGVALPEIPAELDVKPDDNVGDFKRKFNSLLELLRNVAALAVMFGAFATFAASVATAPLDDIPGTAGVVTNVTFDGLLTAHQDISGKADRATTYTKQETDARIVELAPPGITTNDVCAIVTNEVAVGWGEWVLAIPDELTGEGLEYWRQTVHDATISGHVSIGGNQIWIGEMNATSEQDVSQDGTELRFNGAGWGGLSTYLGLYEGDVIATRTHITRNALGLARLSDLPPLTNGLIGADFISTNNAAFVSAVTNCPVVIAAGDAEALTEWGIYGGGGTIGALLAALAAAVAALKKKKMPLYPVGGSGNPVNATYDSGVLTVSPFSMASYTPTASAAFSVAMGALPSDMESGKARDAVLVIDCSLLSEGDEPTVTWGVNYHPRTDAGTDFACVAGAKNVYYISEYASGEFAVGGWTETEGGNA